MTFAATYVYAAQLPASGGATAGAADTYKVTVEQVELCETGSSATTCLSPVVLGTGTQIMDIASVAAGAVAGNYGNASLITVGKTYTWLQTTLNRKITIKADFAVASGRWCSTASGNTAGTTSAFAVGTAGTAAADSETAMIMYIADEASAHAITGWTLNGSADNQAGINISMGSNITGVTTVGGTGTAGDVASSDTYIQHRVELTTPFTMGINVPVIDISFETSGAVYATNTTDKNEDETANDAACALWPGEPTITITLTE